MIFQIPWKSDRPQLPNNHELAHKRLQNLLKRLKSEQLINQYNLQIKKFLSQGYAEHVPDSVVYLNDVESLYKSPWPFMGQEEVNRSIFWLCYMLYIQKDKTNHYLLLNNAKKHELLTSRRLIPNSHSSCNLTLSIRV